MPTEKTTDSTTEHTPFHRRIRFGFVMAAMMAMLLVLSACGPVSNAEPVSDDIELTVDATPDVSGAEAEMLVIGIPDQVVYEAADTRGEAPFAPEAEIAECRPEELIAFLDSEPRIAAAWADAAGVEAEEIAATIRSYTSMVLTVDTRVTNHAYRGGVARGFQATLEAGTAVLVDDAGVPRVRCACGNPLAPAQPVTPTKVPDAPTQVPVTTTTAPPATQTQLDFCGTWQALRPTMSAGPSGSSEAAMTEYLTIVLDGLDQLLEVANATPGFQAEALADLEIYRAAIAHALATGDLTPTPEAALAGQRFESFLIRFCGEGFSEVDDIDPPTHVEDPAVDDTVPSDDGSTGHCGSLQFALLIMVADDLGLDHAATSQFYVDAMQALVNGFDPGPEFDVSDLSLMLANEEIGCQGARAMQQLLIDAGYGPLIEGTELGV